MYALASALPHGLRARSILTTGLSLLVLLLGASRASAIVLPSGFSEVTIADGFNQPTAAAWTPDGRMLVTEKGGVLKVVPAGQTTGTTVLDLSATVNGAWDRGLLGLAVDSAFTSNHFIYVLFTYELDPLNPDGQGQMVSQLRRYVLNNNNTVSSPSIILGSYTTGPCPAPSNTVDCIPSEGLSHSIGTVRSAPDGTLYLGSGDASSFSAVDPQALRVYDERSLAGKIMHIDRNGNGVASHPFCASSTNLTDTCTKVWAKGFRNPFRFTIRPNGSLSVGDVGWSTREELDIVASGGGNYGWPCYEGTIRTPGYRDRSECASEYAKEGTATADVPPSWDYDRTGSNASILSGPEYRSDQYPAGYRGSVFIGDYAQAWIKRAILDAQGKVTSVQPFATQFGGVAIEEAPDGNITYVRIYDGSIQKLVYTAGNQPPVASFTATPSSGAAPLAVAFDASTSTDPDGDPLGYTWEFGDGTTATGKTTSKTYTTGGTFTASLTVSDGRGKSTTATKTITVGSRAPIPTMTVPTATATYRDGQTIAFAGSATDPDEGTLPASKLTWSVVLRHSDHAHPILQNAGVASGNFATTTDHDADSSYEITLTATDSTGLSTSVTRVVRPETTSLTLTSEPAGATISYAGVDHAAPKTLTSAIGFTTSVSAVAQVTSGGRVWNFDHWSDGGTRLHDITVPATASTLTAVYADGGPVAVPGLIAAYGFDETVGTSAVDATGRGHTGTVRNSAWSAAGKHAGALQLNGTDSWVTVADAADLDLTNTMTFSAWVKLSSLKPWQTVVMKEGAGTLAYGLYATNGGTDGKANASAGETTVYTPGKTQANVWTHLAGTYDGSALRIYVDGSLVNTIAGVAKPTATTGVLRIGGNAVWTGEQLNGLIDDVRIYDRALSAAEITTDMSTAVSGGTTPPPPPPPPPAGNGPVVDLRFDDGAGTVAKDSSGRGHDGTIKGALWTTTGKVGGALSFNGSTDWVTVADANDLDLTNALTLEAWVKPKTLKSWQAVISKEAPGTIAYALYATGGSVAQPNAWIGPSGSYSPTPLTAGRWTHLAAVYDASTLRLYVDGQLVDTRTGVAAPPATTGVLRIGGSGVWSGEQFDGLIDEIRVYDRALTAADVAQRAAGTTATVATARAAAAKKTAKRTAPGKARVKVVPRPACRLTTNATARRLAKRAARLGHAVRVAPRCPGTGHRVRPSSAKR
jgi:glucose/arabinose dehydrogenase